MHAMISPEKIRKKQTFTNEYCRLGFMCICESQVHIETKASKLKQTNERKPGGKKEKKNDHEMVPKIMSD